MGMFDGLFQGVSDFVSDYGDDIGNAALMYHGAPPIIPSSGESVIPDLKAESSSKENPFQWTSLIPSAIGAVGSYMGAQQTNKASAFQADKQMAFQERMSSTAHQREVEDLKAAGLNPMLSAKLGGASSPSGAMAPVQNALGQATSSASQNYLLQEQHKYLRAQQNQAESQSEYTDVLKRVELEKMPGYRQYGPQVTSNINQANASTAQMQAQAANLRAMLSELEAASELFKKHPWIKSAQIGSAIGKDISSAIGFGGIVNKLFDFKK